MEPVIKYEHVDELEQIGINYQEQQHSQLQQQHKVTEEPETQITKRAYGQHSEENHGSTAAVFSNSASQTTTQLQSQQMQHQSQQFRGPKCRFIRGDSNLLFGPPFFALEHNYDALARGDTLSARCLTCKVPIRGHKNVSSNFIKHLKRMHPKIYILYENFKLQRMHGVLRQPMCSDLNQHHPGMLQNNNCAALLGASTTFSSLQCANELRNSDDYLQSDQMMQEPVRNDNAVTADYYDTEQLQCVEAELTERDSVQNGRLIRASANASTPTCSDDNELVAANTEETLTTGTLEALIRRVLDEKLQCKSSRRQYKPRIVEEQIGSPTSSSSTSSMSEDIGSVDMSLKSDYSQHAEVQAQLSSLQHEIRLLHRSQRRMQRKLDEMRKILRRRTMVLDLGKTQKKKS